MKKIAIVALLSAFAAAPAVAEGMYGLIDIGSSTVKDACKGLPGGVSCSDSDTAFRFGAGFQVNPTMAIEASYAQLGKAKASAVGFSAEIKPTALQFALVGSLPLQQGFSFFGKIGLSRIATDVSATGSASQSATKTGLGYGLGVQYDFNQQVSARAQYDFVGKGNDTFVDFDIPMYSAGLIYKF